MWPRFGDMILSYTMLTPLCVIFWHSTLLLADKIFDNNRITMLFTGYFFVVVVILLHETLRCMRDVFQYPCIWEFIYDYFVFTICLTYIHGWRAVFDVIKQQSVPPIAIAITVGVLLILMRGLRNVVALPLVVNNDKLVDRFRPHNTLVFYGGVPSCIENDVFLASIVWPSIALLWEGVGDFFEGYKMNKYNMVLYGYIAVAILQTFIREIVEIFVYLNGCHDDTGEPCNELIRILVEDVYIVLAATAVILVWKGLDKYAEAMMAIIRQFTGAGNDIFVAQMSSFTIFWMFGVSMSIFPRSSNLDGGGVTFNSVVFC